MIIYSIQLLGEIECIETNTTQVNPIAEDLSKALSKMVQQRQIYMYQLDPARSLGPSISWQQEKRAAMKGWMAQVK